MLPEAYYYLRQTAHYFQQATSIKTILTALAMVIFLGYVTEKNKRSIDKRKLASMKKVALPAGASRPNKSRAKPTSPLAPMSSSIRRKRHPKSSALDYDTSIQQAIERARATLLTSDLKDVLQGEIYDFIVEHHPKGQPSSRFLAAVTHDFSEYGEPEWRLYLQNLRSRQRYVSFNAAGASLMSLSRRKSIHDTNVQEQAKPLGAADEVQFLFAQLAKRDFKSTRLTPIVGEPILKRFSLVHALWKDTTQPRRDTASSQPETRTLPEPATVPITQATPRNPLKRTASVADLPSLESDVISEDYPFISGGLHAEDADAVERLKARIGQTEDNERICTIGHPNEGRIQQWHLVRKDRLPFHNLFDNPEFAQHFLPPTYHTTYSALGHIFNERRKRSLTDPQVIKALMALGSDLEVAECSRGKVVADVEYMQPYNPRQEWCQVERRYWAALEEWREESLKDLGVWMMNDGTYVTNYDLHINRMGWEPYR